MVSLAAVPETTQDRPRWRDTLRFVLDIARAQPLAVLAMVAVVLVANLRVGVYIAVQGGLVNAFLESDGRAALFWVLAFLAANVVEEAYWVIKPWLFAIMNDRTVHRFQRRVLERAGSAPLVAFEHGTFSARLQRASDDLGAKLANLLMSLIDSLQVLVMGLTLVATIWLISPWLPAILLVAAIPSLILELRVASAVQEALRRHALGSHLLGRIEAIIRDREAAAELRLFRNGPVLVDRWRMARSARAEEVIAAEGRRVRLRGISELIRGIAFSLAVAIALWTIADERLSIGTWVVATTGLRWLSWFARWVVLVMRDAREQVAYAGDLFDFEELADRFIADERRIRTATPAGAATKTGGPMRVELDDVAFAYPGSSRPVVRDLTLTIPDGQTVAIVGANGAGKSTLVRLVTGLYLPDEGIVRLDGIDTRSDGMGTIAPRIAAVFQDYLSFQLPMRDNIGFGAVDREDGGALLDRAASQANLSELVASLPEGHGTWLGREFGERDLSGGQWQRMALARAFYRDADLVIFDEPTAALDPKAELALFERFADLVEDRTAIMISHRLGPARFADRILVMEDGAIVEDGHHDDLIAASGPYARMFAAQAAWYQVAGTT